MDSGLITASTQFQAPQDAVADAMATRAGNISSNLRTDKVKEAAQQFEAFFVGQMMEYMTAGLKADGVFGGGQAEETWRSMLNQEYGKQVAKTGRLGIADTVMKSMLEAQEKRSAAQAAPYETEAAPTDIRTNADVAANAAAAALAGSVARPKSIVA